MPVALERTFTKGGQTTVTSDSATISWLLGEGWTEVGTGAPVVPSLAAGARLAEVARTHQLGQELVANGDLRDWGTSTDQPNGWSGFWQSGKLELVKDIDTYRTAGASWRSRVDSGGLQRFGSAPFKVEPGTAYTVRALIRTEDVTAFAGDILFLSSPGLTDSDFFANELSQQGSGTLTIPVSNEWVEFSHTFTIPAGHRRGRVYINLGSHAGPLTNWLDSASVRGGLSLGLDVPPAWVAPSLGASWVNYGGGYSQPGFTKVNGIVFLRGLIMNGTTGTLFTLPGGYRPSGQDIYLGACNLGIARIDVSSAGDVIMNGYQGTGNNQWMSLASVRFPAEA